MSEFHEVKCPDHIGRVAGNGWILIGVVLELPPGGGELLADTLSSIKYLPTHKMIVVECYCFFTIYYCWAPQCTYLPFRCRGIASFFKSRSFIYVKRRAPQRCSLLLALFFFFCYSIFVRMLRTSCMVPSPLCSRLRVFQIYPRKNQCLRASDAFCAIRLSRFFIVFI